MQINNLQNRAQIGSTNKAQKKNKVTQPPTTPQDKIEIKSVKQNQNTNFSGGAFKIPLKQIGEVLDNGAKEIQKLNSEDEVIDALGILNAKMNEWQNVALDNTQEKPGLMKSIINKITGADNKHESLVNMLGDDLNHENNNLITPVMLKAYEEGAEGVKKVLPEMVKGLKANHERYQFFLDNKLSGNTRPLKTAFNKAVEGANTELRKNKVKLNITNQKLLRSKTQNSGYQNYTILWSTIQNAAKYSPNGGTVEVGFRKEGKNLILSVKDEGIGIPKGEVDKVLHGERASNAQQSGIHGTGYGMNKTRKLVEDQDNQRGGYKIKITSPANPDNKENPGTLIEIPLKLK